jgi:hypothetical protein
MTLAIGQAVDKILAGRNPYPGWITAIHISHCGRKSPRSLRVAIESAQLLCRSTDSTCIQQERKSICSNMSKK